MRRWVEAVVLMSGGYWFGVAVEAGWDWRRWFIGVPTLLVLVDVSRPISEEAT